MQFSQDNYYNSGGGSGGADLQFQSFSYDTKDSAYGGPSYSSSNTGFNSASSYTQPSGQYAYPQGVSWASIRDAFTTKGFGDEPPLLEELGINFSHIKTKGITVLNPLRPVDKHIMDDTDLAGPLVFCLLFGGFLLLSGKAHFGYVYGIAILGWASMYTILNLMSETGIDGYRTASVLGYCLLPMVLLSMISTLLRAHIAGLILSSLS
ncbi:hypothetical protein HDV00_008858, partial [Rhizophlyctis rosea]